MGIKKNQLPNLTLGSVPSGNYWVMPPVINSVLITVGASPTTVIPAAPPGFQNRIVTQSWFNSCGLCLTNNGGLDATVTFALNATPLFSVYNNAIVAAQGTIIPIVSFGCVLPSGTALMAQRVSGPGPVTLTCNYVQEPDEGWVIATGAFTDTPITLVPAPPAGFVTLFGEAGQGGGLAVFNDDDIVHNFQLLLGGVAMDQQNMGPGGPTSGGGGYPLWSFSLVSAFADEVTIKLVEPVSTVSPRFITHYRYMPKQL